MPDSFAELLVHSHLIGLDSVVDFIDSPDLSDIEHIDLHTPYSKVEALLSAHHTMRTGLSYVCLKCVLVSYVLSYESYLAVLSSAPAW